MVGEPYVITVPCLDITDRACADACPVQCIYELVDGQLIGRHEADGEAVNTQQPEDQRDFIDTNRFIFAETSHR